MSEANMVDAYLALQHANAAFAGMSAQEIEDMPFSAYARLRQRAGLAPVDVPVTPAPAPQAPEPHFTETVASPEPVGLDPDSPEYFHAWRSQRVSGGEGKGIFDSVSSRSEAYITATRAQAGRTAMSNANVTEAPALTGRQERQGDMLDRRDLSSRFSTPGNSFQI